MRTPVFLRSCQECGHVQEDKKPVYGEPLSTAYTERKCKACKSISLDYGTEKFYDPTTDSYFPRES